MPTHFHDRWLALALVVPLMLALAATILLAPTPISLDGPSHIYSALVMRHLAHQDPLFARYFQLNSLLIPNWLASALLALTATASSDKWSIGFITTVVIALTIAALFFLVRRASRQPCAWEHTVFVLVILTPLAASAFVFAGFWGFLLSMALCFFAVGLLYEERSIAVRVLVVVLVLLAYWAHPVPVLLTAFFPVWLYVAALMRSSRRGTAGVANLTAGFLMDILPWGVAAVLILRFTATLVHLRLGSEQNLGSAQISRGGPPFLERFADFFRPDALAAIAPSGSVAGLYILLVAALIVGAILSRTFLPWGVISTGPTKAFRVDLAIFSAILFAVYFVVPDRIGNGTEISSRVLLTFLCSVAVLALSGDLASDARYLRLCASLAAVITVGTCAEYVLVSRRLTPAVRELKSAMARVQPRSTMLLLSYRLTPKCGRWPLVDATVPERHWGLLGAMEPDLIVLNDYEPATEHFPTEYRDRRYASLENEFKFTPPEVNAWSEALASSPGVVYVVSWGVPSGTRNSSCGTWVPAPLERDLQRTYQMESEARGASRVQIWRRHDPSAESATR